ncbi:hypothetical protein ACFWCA_48660 [Streptomyces phaeochromogenes]|uniref:hypothetical protein n=1 Tax=Streptomyces phaeochromogenes TaxID=1923 RepID=UPI0036748086
MGNGSPSPRRLTGAEAVVIIVIITAAAVLVAVAGMTVPVMLQLLVGAGLIAVLVIGLATKAPGRGLRAALRGLLTPTV